MSFVFDASAIFEAIVKRDVEILSDQFTVGLAKYELGNVLWKRRVLVGDISDKEYLRLGRVIKRILELMNIISIDCREDEVLRIAKELRITFYDASYVYAAKSKKLPLITQDKELIRKASKAITVMRLEDLKKTQ
ncbi:MAG: type II toxin-antitoxin system VapC family toxin [Candidatus Njordarchaeales archaeon]